MLDVSNKSLAVLCSLLIGGVFLVSGCDKGDKTEDGDAGDVEPGESDSDDTEEDTSSDSETGSGTGSDTVDTGTGSGSDTDEQSTTDEDTEESEGETDDDDVCEDLEIIVDDTDVLVGGDIQFEAQCTMGGYRVIVTDDVEWSSSDTAVATIDDDGLATGVTIGTTSISATYTNPSGVTPGSVVDSVNLNVVGVQLESIVVSPAVVTLTAFGQEQEYVATCYYNDDTDEICTDSVVWSSSQESVATISAGVATAVSNGATQIVATDADNTTIMSEPATLVVALGAICETLTIATSPTRIETVPVGGMINFVATCEYDNNTTVDVTNLVTWTSSNENVSTFSTVAGRQGELTAIAAGAVVVTASVLNSDSTTTTSDNYAVTVVDRTVTGITVSQDATLTSLSDTWTFTAECTYDAGDPGACPDGVVWTSSAEAVATVAATGVATPVANGTTTITATLGTLTGTAELTVDLGAYCDAVTITAAGATTIIEGQTLQLTASCGTSTDAVVAAWSSDAAAVASVDAATGLVTGADVAASSTATITATVTNPDSTTVSGTLVVTVDPRSLVSIEITPGGGTIENIDTTVNLSATCIYDNEVEEACPASDVLWTSSEETIATVSAGVVTGVSNGTSIISASVGDVDADAGAFLVVALGYICDAIEIDYEGETLPVPVGSNFTLTATCIADGLDVTDDVAWSSSNTTAAPIVDGVISGVEALTQTEPEAVVTASLTNPNNTVATDTLNVDVTDAEVIDLTITPAAPADLPAGAEQVFSAECTLSDTTTFDCSALAEWTSAVSSVASVSAGVAVGVVPGDTTITAVLDTESDTVPLTVIPAEVTSIVVTTGDDAASGTVAIGYSRDYMATAVRSNGVTEDATGECDWSTGSASIATVDAGGTATGVARGTTTVIASNCYDDADLTGSAELVVEEIVLEEVWIECDGCDAVSPPAIGLVIDEGLTRQFTLMGRFSNDEEIELTNTADWRMVVEGDSEAELSNLTGSKGQFRAISAAAAQGAVDVTVEAVYTTPDEIEISDTIAIDIVSGTVEAVILTFDDQPNDGESENFTLPVGFSTQGTCMARYTDGHESDVTTSATWNNSNQIYASVVQGLVTGLVEGQSQISCTWDDETSEPLVTVTVLDDCELEEVGISTSTSENDIVDHDGYGSDSFVISRGHEQRLYLLAYYGACGWENVTDLASWDSENATIAVASQTDNGLISIPNDAMLDTTINVTASMGGANVDYVRVTAANPCIQSLAVSPTSLEIPVQVATQVSATATLSTGVSVSVDDGNSDLDWVMGALFEEENSGTPDDGIIRSVVAGTDTVDAVLTELTYETTTLYACGDDLEASISAVVTEDVLQSIAITPESATVQRGASRNFTAEGTFASGQVYDITAGLEWEVAIDAVGSFDSSNPGRFTANTDEDLNNVTSVITASLDQDDTGVDYPTRVGTAQVTIADQQLIALHIFVEEDMGEGSCCNTSGDSCTLPQYVPATFTCKALYADNDTPDIENNPSAWPDATASVAFVSSDTDALTFNETPAGTAATHAVTPANDPVEVTCSMNGITSENEVSVVVSDDSINSSNGVVITGDNTLYVGESSQYTAVGYWTSSLGCMVDLSTVVSWAASDTYGNMSSSGLYEATAGTSGGTTPLIANFEDDEGTTIAGSAAFDLEIMDDCVMDLEIVPPSVTSVVDGEYIDYSARFVLADGSTQNATTVVVWDDVDDSYLIANSEGNGEYWGIAEGTGSVVAEYEGSDPPLCGGLEEVSASSSITVTPAELLRIDIDCFTASNPESEDDAAFELYVYEQADCIATAVYTDEGQDAYFAADLDEGETLEAEHDVTDEADWSVQFAGNVSVDNADAKGHLKALSQNSATELYATWNQMTGNATVTVENWPYCAIEVEGVKGWSEMPIGFTQAYEAWGVWLVDGCDDAEIGENEIMFIDITDWATWSSINPNAATMSNEVASGVGVGPTEIHASYEQIGDEDVDGSTDLDIIAADLDSIRVYTCNASGDDLCASAGTPDAASINAGQSIRLMAEGTYNGGYPLNITDDCVWNIVPSTYVNVATEAGTYTEFASSGNGTAILTCGGISAPVNNSFTLTVNARCIESIDIETTTVGLRTYPEQVPIEFLAEATYSDGTTADVTDDVTWSSVPDNADILEFSDETGAENQAHIREAGTLNEDDLFEIEINASMADNVCTGYENPSLDIFIDPALLLTEIQLLDEVVDMNLGETESMTVMGVYQGSEGELNYNITNAEDLMWATSDVTTVSIDTGDVEITANDIGDAVITVYKQTVVADEEDETDVYVWDTSLVHVGDAVVVDAVAVGKIVERIAEAGLWSSASETTGGEVVGEAIVLAAGGVSTQLMLLPQMSDGEFKASNPTVDALSPVTWEITSPAQNAPLTVDADGMVTTAPAVADEEDVTITGTYSVNGSDVEDSIVITVRPYTIASYRIVAGESDPLVSLDMFVGTTQQLEAVGTDSGGAEFFLTEYSSWSSNNEDYVRVANTGGAKGEAEALLVTGSSSPVTIEAVWLDWRDTTLITTSESVITEVKFVPNSVDNPNDVPVELIPGAYAADYHNLVAVYEGDVEVNIHGGNTGVSFTFLQDIDGELGEPDSPCISVVLDSQDRWFGLRANATWTHNSEENTCFGETVYIVGEYGGFTTTQANSGLVTIVDPDA